MLMHLVLTLYGLAHVNLTANLIEISCVCSWLYAVETALHLPNTFS